MPVFANLERYPEHYSDTLSQEYIELCYIPIRGMVRELSHRNGGRMLDLCCGTGILAELLQDIDGLEYLGIDIAGELIENARERMAGVESFQFEAIDFFAFDTPRKFDLVMLIKAYHHFENKMKSSVLKKVVDWMQPNGAFLLYEICIAPHANREEFAGANADFFNKRISWVEATETMTPKQRTAWEKSRDQSIAGEGEYKVDFGYIVRDLSESGLDVISEARIWPPPGEELFDDPKVGEFLFHLEKS